jgi:TonB family protein
VLRVPVTVLAALAALCAFAAEPGDPAPPEEAEVPDAGAGLVDGGAADAGQPDAWSLPFSAESVRAVLLQHQPEIQACYEETLAAGHDVQGEVVVALVVSPEGFAEKARVKRTTLKNKAVEECVLRTLRRWPFPRPKRAQPIELPFHFDEVGSKSKAEGAPTRPARKKRVGK